MLFKVYDYQGKDKICVIPSDKENQIKLIVVLNISGDEVVQIYYNHNKVDTFNPYQNSRLSDGFNGIKVYRTPKEIFNFFRERGLG